MNNKEKILYELQFEQMLKSKAAEVKNMSKDSIKANSSEIKMYYPLIKAYETKLAIAKEVMEQ